MLDKSSEVAHYCGKPTEGERPLPTLHGIAGFIFVGEDGPDRGSQRNERRGNERGTIYHVLEGY